jgi:hypothetical protein
LDPHPRRPPEEAPQQGGSERSRAEATGRARGGPPKPLREHEKAHAVWETASKERGATPTPPVFIVVCNNTRVSKLVFDCIAGWEEKVREEFQESTGVGLFAIEGMQLELTEMFAYRVDQRTPNELSRYFRDEVDAESEDLYVAP